MVLTKITMGEKPHALVQDPQVNHVAFSLQTPKPRAWSTSQATQKSTVRDHIVSNIHGKETPFARWKTITELFANNSDHMKLTLKDKLQSIKMQKNQTIS